MIRANLKTGPSELTEIASDVDTLTLDHNVKVLYISAYCVNDGTKYTTDPSVKVNNADISTSDYIYRGCYGFSSVNGSGQGLLAKLENLSSGDVITFDNLVGGFGTAKSFHVSYLEG